MPHLIRRLPAAAAVGIATITLLGACGETATQPEAEAALCDAVTAVQTAADDVAALDASSTIDEAQASVDALRSAVDGLETAAADVEAADTAALTAGVDSIQSAIQGTEGSDTIGAAASGVVEASSSLSTATQEIADGAECG